MINIMTGEKNKDKAKRIFICIILILIADIIIMQTEKHNIR